MNPSGADPGFQVRWGALKKIAPSGGRREHFWGISFEKSRFYAKKIYFFQFYGGGDPLDLSLGHLFRNLLTLIVENWSKFWC